jgi:Domain of unknown function (DUF4331)
MTFQILLYLICIILYKAWLFFTLYSPLCRVINSYHHSIPIYPNGRKLTDDIIDTQLAVLTNSQVTTDKVGPHQDLSIVFPYLGSAHPTTQ